MCPIIKLNIPTTEGKSKAMMIEVSAIWKGVNTRLTNKQTKTNKKISKQLH